MGLTEIRSGRSEGDIQADINFRFLKHSLHLYDPGRTQGFLSIDAFVLGGEKLKCESLQNFVEQHVNVQ
jgi:hypothetical protein